MFKILIADDERFIRKGIIAILERGLEEEIQFVEAGNGIEAIDLTWRRRSTFTWLSPTSACRAAAGWNLSKP